MLIAIKSQNAQYPVGVAIAQWQIKGELRTYVLYPINSEDGNFVEIDILFGETDFEPLRTKPSNWADLGDTFGDNSSGYSVDESDIEALYVVWDDGAVAHKAQSTRLFEVYKQQIQDAKTAANEYLEKLAQDKYEAEIKQAKESG